MGKGDKKTKRGKIVNKSYGKLRARKKSNGFIPKPKEVVVVQEETEPKKKAPVKKVAAKKKAPAKKPVAKKTTPKKEEKAK